MQNASVPAEVVEAILVRVEPATAVLSLRLVCLAWRDTIDADRFWKKKFLRAAGAKLPKRKIRSSLVLATVLDNASSFGTNLVQNGDCDREVYNMRDIKFPHWNHMGSCHLNWIQGELSAAGAEPIPAGLLEDTKGTTKCFSVALTYGPNEMHQKICFSRCGGIDVKVLSRLHPTVIFSAWCFISEDRNSSLMTHLKLMTSSEKVLATKQIVLPEVEGHADTHGRWHRLYHSFEEAPDGAERCLVMFLGDDIKVTAISLMLEIL